MCPRQRACEVALLNLSAVDGKYLCNRGLVAHQGCRQVFVTLFAVCKHQIVNLQGDAFFLQALADVLHAFAWPGPRTELRQAGLVNINDDDAAFGLLGSCSAPNPVGRALFKNRKCGGQKNAQPCQHQSRQCQRDEAAPPEARKQRRQLQSTSPQGEAADLSVGCTFLEQVTSLACVMAQGPSQVLIRCSCGFQNTFGADAAFRLETCCAKLA